MKRALLVLAVCAAASLPARAVTLFGITDDNRLVTFDTANPSSLLYSTAVTVGSTSRGQWETSSVISTDAIFGPGTFLINVQAHPTNGNYHRSNISKPGGTYTKAEASFEFAEDGQLLLMRPAP